MPICNLLGSEKDLSVVYWQVNNSKLDALAGRKMTGNSLSLEQEWGRSLNCRSMSECLRIGLITHYKMNTCCNVTLELIILRRHLTGSLKIRIGWSLEDSSTVEICHVQLSPRHQHETSSFLGMWCPGNFPAVAQRRVYLIWVVWVKHWS
jgi:hypothetical protein